MWVKLQDCGCIALPDEILSGLGVGAGAVFDVEHVEGSRVLTLTARPEEVDAVRMPVGAACGVRPNPPAKTTELD